MRKHILLAAAASLALMPAAFAQSSKPGTAKEHTKEQSQLKPADQNFVTKAAIGGMFEVQSSELAKDKAESAEVKDFADMMIRDHDKANKELETLAKDHGANVPTALDAKHEADLKKLQGLQGAEFDKEYIQVQRGAHKEAIGLFQSYSESKDNPQLTSWAGKTLPVLKEHQSHLQKLSPGVAEGAGKPSNTGRSATGSEQPMKKSEPMKKQY